MGFDANTIGKTQALALKTLNVGGGAPTETRVRKIRDLVHSYSLTSTPDGYERLKAGTAANLKRLEPKVQRAKKFVQLAGKKLSRQQLNEESFLAEVAPVNMAVSLHGSLKQMFDAAVAASNQSAIMLLHIATGVLAGRLDDALLREGRYLANEPSLLRIIVQQRISAALSLYNDIVAELGDVPKKLGIQLPGPPGQKT